MAEQLDEDFWAAAVPVSAEDRDEDEVKQPPPASAEAEEDFWASAVPTHSVQPSKIDQETMAKNMGLTVEQLQNLPQMDAQPASQWDIFKDYITDTYASFKVNPGPTRDAYEYLFSRARHAVPEYDEEGNLINVRQEDDDELMERIETERERLRLKHVAPEEGSAADITGIVVSEIADPMALLAGAWGLGARGFARLLKIGAAGAAYEGSAATLDQLVEDHKITDPTAIAIRAGIGGAGGMMLDRVFALGSKIVGKVGKGKKAEKALQQFEQDVLDNRDKGLNLSESWNEAMRKNKLWEGPKDIIDIAGRPINWAKAKLSRDALSPGVRVLDDGSVSRIRIPKGLDDFVGVLSTRIKKISPKVFHALRKFEANSHIRNANYQARTAQFMKGLKNVKGPNRAALTRAIYNGDKAEVFSVISKIGNKDLTQGWSGVRGLMDEIGKDLQNVGSIKGLRDDFFPRKVVDYDGLIKKLGTTQQTLLRQALKKAAAKKGKDLTSAERADVLNKILTRTSKERQVSFRPGFAKERQIDEVTEAMLPHYAPLEEALADYLRGSSHTIEKARAFGRSVAKRANKNENIGSSFGAVVDRELKAGNITLGQANELDRLLGSRFIGGETPAGKTIAASKNFFYMNTLANPISAITQFGDLGLAMYMNGTRAMVKAFLGPRGLWGKDRIKMVDLGLKSIAQEFETARGTAKWLDRMFWASGFKKVDQLGKETMLNASYSKWSRLVKTTKGVDKMASKYRDVFGEADFNKLVMDLRNGKMTENVKLLLWHELSDIQPISMAEVPEKYLAAPNGRIFYMLKTFTIKQMDILRRDAFQELAKGNILKGTKNLGAFTMAFTAANAGAQATKDFILGKETDMEDLVVDSLWKNFGMSEYMVHQQLGKGKISEAMVNLIAPPVGVIDHIAEDLGNFGRSFNTLPDVPLFGKIAYYWFGGGLEKYNERRQERDLKADMGYLDTDKDYLK